MKADREHRRRHLRQRAASSVDHYQARFLLCSFDIASGRVDYRADCFASLCGSVSREKGRASSIFSSYRSDRPERSPQMKLYVVIHSLDESANISACSNDSWTRRAYNSTHGKVSEELLNAKGRGPRGPRP